MENETVSPTLLEAYLTFASMMEPLHAFLVGQRKMFEEEGFSPTAAEQMVTAMAPMMFSMVLEGQKRY